MAGRSWPLGCCAFYYQYSWNKKSLLGASRYLLRVFMEANSYVLCPLLARREVSVSIWKDRHPCSNSCTHVPAVVQRWTAGFSARQHQSPQGAFLPVRYWLLIPAASSTGRYRNPVSTRSLDVTTWMYSSSVCFASPLRPHSLEQSCSHHFLYSLTLPAHGNCPQSFLNSPG